MVLSHKAKQYLLAALKLFILLGAAYFIYYRLKNTPQNAATVWKDQIESNLGTIIIVVVVGLVATLLNWALEAKKWQLLVSSRYVIAYKTAWKQTYGAFTASIMTPQRVGEYGAKALYFPKDPRKTILWLTLLGNSAQMLVTLVLGMVGLIGLVALFDLKINTVNAILAGVAILFLGVLGYLLRERELLFQGLSIKNVLKKVSELRSALITKVLLLSLARYIIFAGMFYITLGVLGTWINAIDAIVLLGAYYLLVSVAPSLFLLDIVVKGGIAIWLFSLCFIPESKILAAIVFNWLLNFVFTAFIGSYFVIKFKPAAQ